MIKGAAVLPVPGLDPVELSRSAVFLSPVLCADSVKAVRGFGFSRAAEQLPLHNKRIKGRALFCIAALAACKTDIG